MPVVNHVVLASGAVVAVSVAVAVAAALYENPELRRYAEDVRRRIAMAYNSIGANAGHNTSHREPVFNRPEDADGFLQSRAGTGAEPGVDADDESRRRQREELLYWNSVRLNKKQPLSEEKGAIELDEKKALPPAPRRGSSFEDFLKQDESAEKGTFVYNTGTDLRKDGNSLRQRGDGARAFAASMLANPFADENHIDQDELTPDHDDASDIYSATTRDPDDAPLAVLEPKPLIHVAEEAEIPRSEKSFTLDRSVGPSSATVSSAGGNQDEAYTSIQAWAQESSRDFYSPLPVTPLAPVSEPDLVSDASEDGQLTPTDSMSVVDVANETHSSHDGETGRHYDVMSESSGMLTPSSWSDVGSVDSDWDDPR